MKTKLPARVRASGGRKRTAGAPRRKRSFVPRSLLDWVLAIACAVVIAFAVTSIGGSSTGSAATQRTATVSRGVVQSTVSGNGSLEAAEEVELNFGASGEVIAIDAKAGEKVSKGEILARVDASSARASLASAEAQLFESEESLEAAEEAEEEEAEAEAEETAASYDGGATTVLSAYTAEQGERLDVVDPEEQATQEAEEQVEAAAEEKKVAEEKKAKEEEKAAAIEEKKAAEQERKAAEEKKAAEQEEQAAEAKAAVPAQEAEATAAPSTSAAGAEESGTGAVGGASVSVPTAEANLREAQLSVKSARQEVRETTLRAPISGTIAAVSGAVGENVSGESSSSSAAGGASEASTAGALGATGGETTSSSSGSAFIVLAQLHRLKLEVSFSESDIGKVKVGQTATIAVDSLEGTELAGRVTSVSVLPSEGSTSVVEYPATILLTQSAKGLRAGMSASAEVVVEQVKNAIAVSSEAIATGPSKTVTVSEGGKKVEKTVTTGLVGDETTQIVSGLKAGETVVLPEATVATAAGGEAGGLAEGAEAGGFRGGGALPAGGAFPAGGAGGGFPGGG